MPRKNIADPRLTENSDPCPACELQREAQDKTKFFRPPISCNVCKGKGYLTVSDAALVRRAVAWAREHYWPKVN